MALGSVHLQEIALRTNVALQRHDNGFTDGIDGRIGDLSEQLAEIFVQQDEALGRGKRAEHHYPWSQGLPWSQQP